MKVNFGLPGWCDIGPDNSKEVNFENRQTSHGVLKKYNVVVSTRECLTESARATVPSIAQIIFIYLNIFIKYQSRNT